MAPHRRARALVWGLAAITVSGCTHTVVPPRADAQSSSVFLLDHGRTSSLVLPRGDAFARYAYGEWDWYARNRTGVFRGSGALLSDTRGAIGRSVFGAAPTLEAVRRAVQVPVQEGWEIRVPAARARVLEEQLSALFRRQADEVVDNRRVALRFVPHPEPYSLTHNSNHVTADWLRRLTCRVETSGPLSRWEVLPSDRRQ